MPCVEPLCISICRFVVVIGCNIENHAYIAREGLVKLARMEAFLPKDQENTRGGSDGKGMLPFELDRHVTNSARAYSQRSTRSSNDDNDEEHDLHMLQKRLDEGSSSSRSKEKSKRSSYEAFWARLTSAAGKTLGALRSRVSAEGCLPIRTENAYSRNHERDLGAAHEALSLPKILGLDYLVDEDLQPWLIVSGHPARSSTEQETAFSVV